VPITVVKPSAAVLDVVREHLVRISTLGRFRTKRLSAAAPASLSLAVPHRVYNLGLSDIKGANPIGKARPSAWRYLVVEEGTVIAAAEAIQRTANAKPLFSNTNEGAFVDSMAKAVEAAEQLPEVEAGNYELAVLRVPALYVIALWLKGAGAKRPDDIFIPLEPAPAGLKAGERMSAGDLNAALLTLKAERGKSTSTSS
jgi:hypothetical protein